MRLLMCYYLMLNILLSHHLLQFGLCHLHPLSFYILVVPPFHLCNSHWMLSQLVYLKIFVFAEFILYCYIL